jgi:hypothetical protein
MRPAQGLGLGNFLLSTTKTSQPFSDRTLAADAPAGPAPTTRMSQSNDFTMIIFWRGVWEYLEMITQRQIKPASWASVNDKASIPTVPRELDKMEKTLRAIGT